MSDQGGHAEQPDAAPGTVARWVLASRPKTLWAAVAPVLVGSALAARDDALQLLWAGAALLAALCIQIGTNLHNDWEDAKRGADTEQRTGPTRVTQAGLLSPAQVLRAAVAMFAVGAVLAVLAVLRAGWPLAAVFVASLLAAVGYTGGPRPFGYLGLGELFVLVFFGPVAVGATYYLQALRLPSLVLCVGLGPGLLATAILVVNNLRDRHTDRAAGKRTIAVRFGAGFARGAYAVSVVVGALLPAALLVAASAPPTRWLYAAPALVLVPGIIQLVRVAGRSDGRELNPALARTAQLLLLQSVLIGGAAALAVALR